MDTREDQEHAPGAVEHLTPEDCWTLVRAHSIGRLAIERDDGGPDVMPLNYLVDGDSVVMRSAPGGKLRSLRARPQAAFEIDGMDPGHFWSVVIRGEARRLDRDEEIESSGVLDLDASAPGGKHNFIRVSAATITGRRFPRPVPPEVADHASSASMSVSPRETRPQKPHPIPHYAPKPTR